jgi:hypothetical protein
MRMAGEAAACGTSEFRGGDRQRKRKREREFDVLCSLFLSLPLPPPPSLDAFVPSVLTSVPDCTNPQQFTQTLKSLSLSRAGSLSSPTFLHRISQPKFFFTALGALRPGTRGQDGGEGKERFTKNHWHS